MFNLVETKIKTHYVCTYTGPFMKGQVVWDTADHKSSEHKVELTEILLPRQRNNYPYIPEEYKDIPPAWLLFPRPVEITFNVEYHTNRKVWDEGRYDYVESLYSFWIDCEELDIFTYDDRYQRDLCDWQYTDGFRWALNNFADRVSGIQQHVACYTNAEWREAARDRKYYQLIRDSKLIPLV